MKGLKNFTVDLPGTFRCVICNFSIGFANVDQTRFVIDVNEQGTLLAIVTFLTWGPSEIPVLNINR